MVQALRSKDISREHKEKPANFWATQTRVICRFPNTQHLGLETCTSTTNASPRRRLAENTHSTWQLVTCLSFHQQRCIPLDPGSKSPAAQGSIFRTQKAVEEQRDIKIRAEFKLDSRRQSTRPRCCPDKSFRSHWQADSNE